MGSKDVGLLLMVLMLILAFDCGNCNIQQIRKTNSIRSNAATRVENFHSIVGRDFRSHHRFRRSILNDAETKEVVDAHNRVRRMEGASNMEKMIWSSELGKISNDWAEKCIWSHSKSPNVGENLYAISNTFSINLTAAILDWYNEKKDYNYDTLACNAEMCGHYTQVVWATSRELGCATMRCPTLEETDFVNASYLVCNYRPAGNVKDVKPFMKGAPCSSCENRSWWCNEGLCDQSCMPATPTCECRRVCRNYVSLDNATCSCSCEDGWYGSDCSIECKDYDPLCNPTNGEMYDPSTCTDATYGAYIRHRCPAMCKQCKAKNHTTSTKPSLPSMLVVWLSGLTLCKFRSM